MSKGERWSRPEMKPGLPMQLYGFWRTPHPQTPCASKWAGMRGDSRRRISASIVCAIATWNSTKVCCKKSVPVLTRERRRELERDRTRDLRTATAAEGGDHSAEPALCGGTGGASRIAVAALAGRPGR